MEKITCVVLGTGSIGLRHLRVLQQSPHVIPLAHPIRQTRSAELKEQGFTVISHWDQAKELGATHAIIATDTSRHQEDIHMAVDAGCHVLSEKPLAIDMPTAFSALKHAREAGRVLTVGSCLRFQHALNVFIENLALLGQLHTVRIECQSYLPDWRPGRDFQKSYSASPEQGGVLRDLIHEIDYAGWIFGWPTDLTARVKATQRLGIPIDDAAEIFWESENDVSLSISLDYLSRPGRRQMRAYGEGGTIEWDGIEKTVKISLADGTVREIRSSQTADDMYLEQDLAFLAEPAVSNSVASAADGVRALGICDAARLSSGENRQVRVNYPDGL
jgi:predicted dehydrogenase